MKVILIKDVAKVGRKYDVKNVADGYALNLLVPRGLAVIATEEAIKKYNTEKAKIAGNKILSDELLSKNMDSLSKVSITVSGKASDKGHLFAGVHKDQIVSELKKQAQIDMIPEYIVLDKPIKEVGEHEVEIKSGDKSSKFKLIIKAL